MNYNSFATRNDASLISQLLVSLASPVLTFPRGFCDCFPKKKHLVMVHVSNALQLIKASTA